MMQAVGIRPNGRAAVVAPEGDASSRIARPGSTKDPKTSPGRRAAASTSPERTGPIATAGITLEVMDGPMDGAVFAGPADSVRIGRGAENELALYADRSVSNRHAALTWSAENGAWTVEDRKSTNGTWVNGSRLSSPCRLELGSDFLVGNAVVRAMSYEGSAAFLPRAEQVREDWGRLVEQLDSGAAAGYGAALGVAVQERRAFLTDRHLLLGLVIANPGLPVVARGKGPLGARVLGGAVRQNEYWSGSAAWIDHHLRAVGRDDEVLFESDLTITPRVLHVMQRAAERVTARGEERITPPDLLVAMLSGLSPRLIEILAREGVDAEHIVSQLEDVTESRTLVTSVAERVVPPTPGAVGPPVQLTTGDPSLDVRARDTANELYSVASLYHLASPEERRTALARVLTTSLGQVSAQDRGRFLAQLRVLFPVLPGIAVDTVEVDRLRARVSDLERRTSAPAAEDTPRATVPAPWRLVAARENDAQLLALDGEDRVAVNLLREVLAFAIAVEQFIVGMVNNLTMQGRVTDVFLLPGFRTNILQNSERLAQGKPFKLDELRTYLAAVQAWLVAATAAYHEAPEVWFREFWKKASPTAIEAGLQEPGKKKVFRIEAVELWEQYKAVSRALSAELVADEILHVVRRRAEEQFARLRERSKQP